jgi:hypothetical protein
MTNFIKSIQKGKAFNASPKYIAGLSLAKAILLLTLLCLAGLNKVQAGVSAYSFTSASGTYTALSSPTVIATATTTVTLDDVTYTYASGTIPFTFTYNGTGYTGFYVNTNGFIEFGSTAPASNTYTPISTYANVISAFGADLQGNVATGTFGEMSYQTLGSSPNRVFVIQWKNWKKFSGAATQLFNFQIRLSETTNNIDIQYGSFTGLASYTPQVGISGSPNSDFNNRTSTTTWTGGGTAGTLNTSTMTTSTTIGPASGLDYTWTPPNYSIAPNCVTSSTPLNNATSVSGNPTISWVANLAAGTPQSYDVYFGTSSSSPTFIGNQAGTSYTPATALASATDYYYKIVPVNSAGSATGCSISKFTTGTVITGLKTIAPSGADYTTITAAITAMKSINQGFSGSVILELQSTYSSASETFPLTFSGLSTSATNNITIRPATGASALSISSANTTSTLDLNGITYLTIDGRAGGIGVSSALTVANTATTGLAARFINDASNNTLKYLTFTGVNTSTTGGVIQFSTAVTTGNDYNTISNCDIRDGATTPNVGIYALGTTGIDNDHNTISNSNIYNFWASNAESDAVKLMGGNTDWTITSNSIYQTAARTASGSGVIVYPFNINNSASANNMTITYNSIGGNAPSCGGSAWTVTGNFANRFIVISLWLLLQHLRSLTIHIRILAGYTMLAQA